MVELKSNKTMIAAVVILLILVGLLIFFNKENANKLFFFVLVAAIVLYFMFFKEKKRYDVHDAIAMITVRHTKDFGMPLDDTDVEATEFPLNSGRYLIDFKNDGVTYEWKDAMILGKQIKQLSNVRHDMEKSRIVENIASKQSADDAIKDGLKKFGVVTDEKTNI